jgi:IS1 family transposase
LGLSLLNVGEKARFFTDYWSAYASVFSEGQHAAVGKHTGLTNHIERLC